MKRVFLISLLSSIAFSLLLGATAGSSIRLMTVPTPSSRSTPPQMPEKRLEPRPIASGDAQVPPFDRILAEAPGKPGPRPSAAVEPSPATSLAIIDRAVGEVRSASPPQITCPTPMSLMLHSAFGEARMQALAQAILDRGWHTISYRDLETMVHSGQCPPEQTVIVSIDDLGTDWLRPDFKRMVKVFNDRGLVVVVGVVVHGPQDASIWKYLRGLEALGNEVASHTVDHLNLPQLDEDALAEQLDESYTTICLNLGKCPATLILPFGNIDPDGRVLAAAGAYTFVVGIPGGHTFAGAPPYFLGRIPPVNENQEQSLSSLEASFQVRPSE